MTAGRTVSSPDQRRHCWPILCSGHTGNAKTLYNGIVIDVPDDGNSETVVNIYWRRGNFIGDEKIDTILFNNAAGLIHGVDPGATAGQGIYAILEGFSGALAPADSAPATPAAFASPRRAGSTAHLSASRNSSAIPASTSFTVDRGTSRREQADVIHGFNQNTDNTQSDTVRIDGGLVPRSRIRYAIEDVDGDGGDDTVVYDIGPDGTGTPENNILVVLDGYSGGIFYTRDPNTNELVLNAADTDVSEHQPPLVPNAVSGTAGHDLPFPIGTTNRPENARHVTGFREEERQACRQLSRL